jgi:hypothetical protein
LDDFIARLFRRAHLPPSVALVGLIYLDRLKNNLPKHARGDVDTPYRLFLSAILSASKFLSESGTCLTSHSISEMTDYIYTIQDVNSMERSFLGLIKYNLFVTMDQVKEYLARHGDLLQMYLVE